MTDIAYLMEEGTSLQQRNVFRLRDCRVRIIGKKNRGHPPRFFTGLCGYPN